MKILEAWLQDIPQQFLGKHNIEVLLSAFARQLQELYQVLEDLNTKTTLDNAVGKNLDMEGTIIGLTRKEAGLLAGLNVGAPVISDRRYRNFLKYKLLVNTNDCTYYDLIYGIELLWNLQGVRYKEDPDYPATILFQSDRINLDDKDTIEFQPSLCIRPAGVGVMVRKIFEDCIDVGINVDVPLMLKINCGFYPRYIAEALMLDGTWKLNGEKSLNGYDTNDLLDFYPVTVSFVMDVKKEVLIQAITKICSKSFFELETQNRITLRSSFYPRYNTGFLSLNGMWELNGERFLNGYDTEDLLDLHPLVLFLTMNIKKEILAQAISKMIFFTPFEMQIKNGINVNFGVEEFIEEQLNLFVSANAEVQERTESRISVSAECRERTSSDVKAKVKMESMVELKNQFTVRLMNEVKKKISSSGGARLCFPIIERTSAYINMTQSMKTIVKKDIGASNRFQGSCKVFSGTHSFLTVEKNLWYLDGQHKLDGKLLNAEIIEYDLQ